MKIVILDDIQSDAEKLEFYINKSMKDNLLEYEINQYSKPEDLLKNEDTGKIEIAFLDIFMDGMTGIQVAEKIREKNSECIIVFISNSNSFAHESYSLGALYYLLKPYGYEQFEKIMQIIKTRLNYKSCFIEIKGKKELIKIPVSDIIFADYYNHYIQLHKKDETVKTYAIPFSEIEKTLLEFRNFLWCYRNIIINMNEVSKLEDKNFIMSTGDIIPINREKQKKIKENYREFIFSQAENEFK